MLKTSPADDKPITSVVSEQTHSLQEIVLVKSSKDLQKEKLMERFTIHSQKEADLSYPFCFELFDSTFAFQEA